MPLYRTANDTLEPIIKQIEASGETVVQIERVPKTNTRAEEFLILTNVPVNDTGFAWAPDRMRGGA
jgi:hypothetical protein